PPACQSQHFLVLQAQALALFYRHGDTARGPTAAGGVDQLFLLRPHGALEDRAKPVFERGLEYEELVRVDPPFDDTLAQAIGTVNEHHVGKTTFRIEGKQ